MTTESRYASWVVPVARWILRLCGLALAAAGLFELVSVRPQLPFGAGILIVVGLVCVGVSFARKESQLAEVTKTLIEHGP